MTKPALRFRPATGEDLPALVAMLADDLLGQAREAPAEPLANDYRRALIVEALARARERGCHLVQLTTDKTRPEALRFYVRLGFRASHEGLKLPLDGGTAR